MPTPVVSADKMTIGKAGGGKHWTRAEVEARQAAAEGAKRNRRVNIKPPDWLDEKALDVWKRTRKAIKSLEILDNVDSEMLGIYCDAVARYSEFAKMARRDVGNGVDAKDLNELAKSATSYARLALQTAEKLGLTPNGRARLAKKKAEKGQPDPFGNEFG